MLDPNKLSDLMAAIADLALRIGTASGVLIQNMWINEGNGTLNVTYSSGQSVVLGVVKGSDGTDGTDGIGILDVQLYDDPLEPGQVYIQTTLSNGIILRTQSSLNGYHGKSIKDAYAENNQLYFVLDDANSTTLTPIAIDGLQAVSVVGVEARDDGNGVELFWQLSNGTEISSGVAEDLRGRSVLSVTKNNGKFYVTYSDAPSTPVLIGSARAIDSMGLLNGTLVVYYDDAPSTPVTLGALGAITGAEVNEDAELVFFTNQPAPNDTINVGPVANLKGADGKNIAAVRIENNEFILTLDGGIDLPGIPVSGLTPISVTGARYDTTEDELYLILSNATEIATGLSGEIRGRGIVDASVGVGGELYVKYSDDPGTNVQIATIPIIIGSDLYQGKLRIYYSTAPTTPVEVGQLLGFTNLNLQSNGQLIATMSNNQQIVVGTIKAVSSMGVNVGNLIVTYNDGTQVNLGQVVGPKGDDGVSVTSAEVNADGDLILGKSDSTEVNAGSVRSVVRNHIGTTTTVTATANQTVFMRAHNGGGLVFVNGSLVDDQFLDFNLLDRIVYSGTALNAGDKVKIVTYVAGGVSETGRGVISVELAEGSATAYVVTLENNDTFIIETATPVNLEDLPPGIDSITVLPNGNLQIVLTNGDIIDAGATSNAINTVNAYIDSNSDLHIVLSDDTDINVGSIMSNLTIVDAHINGSGELIIEFSTGGTFNAGVTATYVSSATIDSNDELIITLSNGTIINAGTARNPLLGSVYDFVTTAGQYEFPVLHQGFGVSITINGSTLNAPEIDLSGPYVKVVTPRVSGDQVRIIMFSQGSVAATSVLGVNDAPKSSYYGKNDAGDVGFHPLALTKFAIPYVFEALPGQTAFSVPHTGANSVAVYVQGVRRTTGITYPAGLVVLSPAMTGGENVTIDLLKSPRSPGDMLVGSYARVTYDTYSWGGTFNAGAWRIRAINKIVSDSIGVHLDSNRIILPAGTYYVKGYAACHGVRQNVPRLFNQTTGRELLMGSAQFASPQPIQSNGTPDCHTPIEGYFELASQSAVVLQHKCVTSYGGYGFGRGNGEGWAPGSKVPASILGIPGRLVDLQLWKVG